ncbi:MAG: TonB-dependent receptor [Bacteroidales bacterium]|nr:TonB-dependent receptor [Bacteroidales bacterium]
MKKLILFLLLWPAFLLPAEAQRTLHGKISDAGGDPLPGAAIKVAGTETGFIADTDGRYEIRGVRFPARIIVSYIGYADTEIDLTGNEAVPYDIVLDDSKNILDEVVVVGFGTQKKSTLSGSVGIVDGATLNQRPVVSAANALQGADPSVYITTSNGSANSSASINIRGTLSVNGGSPLVLIDGVEGSLAMLNPNDIESVSILKDASTCAIYGAKASAGVVLVTTKQGSTGKSRVTYGFRQGWIQPTTDMDLITTGYDHISIINYFQQHSFHSSRLNEYDYTVANGELLKLFERRNDVVENPARPWVEAGSDGYYHYYGNFDWFHYFYNTNRPVSEHDFSVSGGSGGIRYYVGGRYYNETGLLKGSLSDKFRSYSVRSKVTAQVNRFIRFSNNLSYAKKNYAWQGNSDMESTFENLWRYGSPAFSPYNPDGSLVNYPIELAGAAKTNMMNNSANQALAGTNHNSKDTGHLTMTSKLEFMPFRGFTLTGQYDFRRIDTYNTYRTGKYFWSNQPGIINEMSGTTNSYKEDRDWREVHVATLTAQYENNWGGHYLKLLAGAQYEASHTSDFTVKGVPVLVDGYDTFALIDQSADENGLPRASYTVSNSNSEYATLGFFGRVNYDWKGRYIFEASARYDGTSRFGAQHRWGFFPSASLAWKFSDEPFFAALRPAVSEGKLRFSAGSLGNQQVSNYYYIEKISIDNTQDYTFDGQTKSRYASISAPVSDSLTWETVNTYDAGLDLSFFDQKLKFVGDYYIRDTKDMLTASVALPEVFGATEPKENCADLRTYGWEFSLSWRDSFMLGGKRFHYGLTGFLGDRRTFFTRYYNPTGTLDSHYVGEELGTIWGFRSGGLFASDEEAREYTLAVDSRQYQPGYYYPGGGVCVDGEGAKAGDFKLLDIGGPDGEPDGIISKGRNTLDDHGDLAVIGTTQPHFNYSFRIDFDWNGFDFSAFFQGIGHKDWYPKGTYGGYAFWGPYSSTSVTFIHKRFMDNVWTPEHPDAYFPRPRGYSAYTSNDYYTGLGSANDYFLQNIGYLRLKNLTLGYALPAKLSRKIAVEKLRFYVSGENLFYFSPLRKHTRLIDPELANASGVATSNTGVGYLYPRTLSVGATITF